MKALSALALLALGCARPPVEGPAPQTPPEEERWLSVTQLKAARVHTVTAEKRPLSRTTTLGGHITFDDARVTHVFSPVTGRVTRVFASLGDAVKRGAPLAELDSPDVGVALSDLVKASADAEAARRESERQEELYAARAAPLKDLELAKDGYLRAKAELERARQKNRLLRVSESAQAAVSQTFVLRSPMDGRVVARSLSVGIEVQGQYSQGAASDLFTIGDLDEVWVLADVHEQDVGRVAVGQPVTARTVAYPDAPFPGRVTWVSDVLDPQTHTARVRVDVPNADHRLKPEMLVTLEVESAREESVVVPRSAVVRLGDIDVVFVDAGEAPGQRRRFQRRRVTMPAALSADGLVPVLRGLDAGEVVVDRGALLLSEG